MTGVALAPGSIDPLGRGFAVSAVRGADGRRLVVRGELDLATAPRLRVAISSEEKARPDVLKLDLRELAFMDVSGMRILLDAARRARRDGRQLIVLNPQPAIRRLFALTAVDRTITIAFD
jgi:anti-anti-sigma factor